MKEEGRNQNLPQNNLREMLIQLLHLVLNLICLQRGKEMNRYLPPPNKRVSLVIVLSMILLSFLQNLLQTQALQQPTNQDSLHLIFQPLRAPKP